MKTYRGYNGGGDTSTPHVVTVEEQERSPVFDTPVGEPTVAMLEHHVRHSPTGFSWGYRGSGPADLARCILWDYLGEAPTGTCYQLFKDSFVAHWPQDGDWELTGKQIENWLERYREALSARVPNTPVYVTEREYEAWLNSPPETTEGLE